MIFFVVFMLGSYQQYAYYVIIKPCFWYTTCIWHFQVSSKCICMLKCKLYIQTIY